MLKRAPLIVAIVLVLPQLLYVGSYLAVVKPPYHPHPWVMAMNLESWQPNYRVGGRYAAWVYWPLEQLDRKLRPELWEYPPQFRPTKSL